MTKTYCDRCGKETDSRELAEVTSWAFEEPTLELCPSCLKLLKEWLKGKK